MSNTVTSTYIDLATKDELEKYLYEGRTAITYFVRCVRKSTWFSQVPIILQQDGGTPDFRSDGFAVKVSRGGDYLDQVWVRLTTPEITIRDQAQGNPNLIAQWTAKFMHNLFRNIKITFNDLPVQEFDNYWLDFWAAFTIPESKNVGYKNMIGDFLEMTEMYGPLQPAGLVIPAFTLNLPLPFWFTRGNPGQDGHGTNGSGNALPAGALLFNETRIVFDIRDWRRLLQLTDTSTDMPSTDYDTALVSQDIHLRDVQVWGNYAVVSNDERDKMGKCPRDMVIEQVQKNSERTFDVGQATDTIPPPLNSYDLRFSHGIKAIFFAARNNSWPNLWSIYSTNPQSGAGREADPISEVSLLYENTFRLHTMGVDFFSLIQPWYHFSRIPDETGYHVYSYAIWPEKLDPSGSTNYGVLTNVSIQARGSLEAQRVTGCALNPNPPPIPSADCAVANPASFVFIVRVLNWNVIRMVGGAIGLPVL